MIGTIEQAIVDRLAACAAPTGAFGYHADVASYGNELDDDIRTVVRRLPALWVTFAGADAPDDTGRRTARYVVMCGAESRRNEAASRRGDGGRPGAYQLVTDAAAALDDWDTGRPEVERVVAGAIRTIAAGAFDRQHVAVYGLDIAARYVPPAPAAGGLADFRTFHADWDVPPAGLAPPLPATNPDAADTVALPTEEEQP